MPTYFTREQADALLPQVESLLREIQALRLAAAELAAQLATQREKVAGNGHLPQDDQRRMRDDLAGINERIAARIEEIQAQGILVKDLDTGLIDFPTLRDGREVYLCWKLGEDRVRWWHPIEAGFSGRQPLEDD
ncbi:MAG TPA: DUF2203 domain-containing protein [Ktedonobacterales bacterium]|jgi:hypothetical protein|nr:DUF2203 domain-containing protein [Ktedonobacterales bacterium]